MGYYTLPPIRFRFNSSKNTSFVFAVASVVGLAFFGESLWFPKTWLEVLYAFICSVYLFFIGCWLMSVTENRLESTLNTVLRKSAFGFWGLSAIFGLASIFMAACRRPYRIRSTPESWCFDWCFFLVIALVCVGTVAFQIYRAGSRMR